jgi:ribosomal protein L7/L12
MAAVGFSLFSGNANAMNTKAGLITNLLATAALALPGVALADAKAMFEASCADCHEAADLKGKSAADLQKVEAVKQHKGKVKLSADEAKALAEFLAK